MRISRIRWQRDLGAGGDDNQARASRLPVAALALPRPGGSGAAGSCSTAPQRCRRYRQASTSAPQAGQVGWSRGRGWWRRLLNDAARATASSTTGSGTAASGAGSTVCRSSFLQARLLQACEPLQTAAASASGSCHALVRQRLPTSTGLCGPARAGQALRPTTRHTRRSKRPRRPGPPPPQAWQVAGCCGLIRRRLLGRLDCRWLFLGRHRLPAPLATAPAPPAASRRSRRMPRRAHCLHRRRRRSHSRQPGQAQPLGQPPRAPESRATLIAKDSSFSGLVSTIGTILPWFDSSFYSLVQRVSG